MNPLCLHHAAEETLLCVGLHSVIGQLCSWVHPPPIPLPAEEDSVADLPGDGQCFTRLIVEASACGGARAAHKALLSDDYRPSDLRWCGGELISDSAKYPQKKLN